MCYATYMKVAIIIPSINLWNQYTKPCIDSIKTSHNYRILLIDNASTDETLVEAGKLVSDTFSHRRNNVRLSCAQSWNMGIKDAWERGFDYVLVLNNDVILHPDCIDRMVERFEKGGVGMVTALDVRGECALPMMIMNKKSKDYEDVPEAPHPNFSCYMINKECWDIVGEIDEGFEKAYWEDNDFHKRMVLSGVNAIVYPPALFYHFGSKTQNEALGKPIVDGQLFEKNRAYYKGKWGGNPGEDKYEHPFNNEKFTVKYTKQNNG